VFHVKHLQRPETPLDHSCLTSLALSYVRENERQRGWRHPFDPRSLTQSLRLGGSQFLLQLVGKATKRGIREIWRNLMGFIAPQPFNIPGLPFDVLGI